MNPKKDLSSNLMKIGIYLIALAFLGFLLIGVITIMPTLFRTTEKNDFEVSDAKYITDFGETAMNLTYKGTSPMNVSILATEDLNHYPINHTQSLGLMNKGDWKIVAFRGYVTWCEVIYDGKRTKITFNPKHTTISESPP